MENPAATSLVSPNIRKPFPLICSSIAADMLLQHCRRGVEAAVTGEKNMLVTQPHDGRTSDQEPHTQAAGFQSAYQK